MENEGEGNKPEVTRTDGGFSEEKMDKRVDLGISIKQSQSGQIHMQTPSIGGQVFIPKKKPQVIFQAQKEEEK